MLEATDKVVYFEKLLSSPLDSSSILKSLDPPKHFDAAQFSNYIPEPDYPSQEKALRSVQDFIKSIESKNNSRLFSRWLSKNSSSGVGLYLDGGFGIGKTHLLASAYHSFSGNKVFLSFQELMFLVGLERLQGVVELLQGTQLLVIDEFELDDPANTRITTNLLQQLFDSGVSILTSSNTPPGALGEGKFSVEDFKRELGKLTERFTTLRIDGEDYRIIHHLNDHSVTNWVESDALLESIIGKFSIDNSMINMEFPYFLKVLSKAHPMRVRSALSTIRVMILHGISTIAHPHEALRFVYAIDKAYDNNIAFFASSTIAPEELFHPSYFTGGDTKKYLRTISRLKEMIRG